MGEETTPQLHKDRNKILVKYAEHSFSAALDEINEALNSEKNHSKNYGKKENTTKILVKNIRGSAPILLSSKNLNIFKFFLLILTK